MTSHFPVGLQQPPQQLLAAQGLGNPGHLHHGPSSHVGLDKRQTTDNETSIPAKEVLEQESLKSAVESSTRIKTELNLSDHQLPLLQYTEIAPFPPRPLLNASARRIQVPSGASVLMKPTSAPGNNHVADARGQGQVMPASARVYPQGNVADLSSWKGKQLEDNLSEQTIKSGFQNKPLITNESNTARPSLWSHLKNKGGPQTLSSLFVNLLEKRQATGRVTGSSTFKPPPRLAMSNARRESFFRELSDPLWPMRKLNRSVPHTISGRVLLDQCLSKNIPIPRAVWLAKCIGANDIRALKRKATSVTTTMGSEAKYIKDWTVHVEQFVKSVVSGVGESDWKAKADYAIRLSSHLFSEHLLDEEHYLDWLLSACESCTTQHLPIWLVLIQIYWTSLMVNRRRGSRLAESLLNHLEQLTAEESEDILQPVISRVEALLTVMAVHHNGCLILPRSWSRFRKLVLSISTTTADPGVQASVAKLVFRNDRLANSSASTGNGTSSRKSRIISILDNVPLDLPISQLTEKCLEVEADIQSVVRILLSWSASVYRQGEYRVYLTARLLKRLRQQSDNTDEMIWETIQDISQESGISKTNLFKVVVELVRAKQFAVGRFIQHLISIGAPDSNNDRHRCLLELLSHIPGRGLNVGISSIRSDLLDSAGLSSISIRGACQKLEEEILDDLSTEDNDLLQTESKPKRYAQGVVSLSQAFDLGHHIRNHLLSIIREISTTGSDHWNKPGTVKSFESTFFFARTLLEELEQYPCLVDILGMSLDFDNQVILTSIVHTIHYGHRCYVSMGAMKSLFDKLITCYESIRNLQPLIRPFCSAILELSSTLNVSKSLVSQLTQDVLRSDQLNAAAICSPASDNADIMQLSTLDFEDEIERILSSGTTMDERMVARVFDRIFKKIQEVYKQPATDRFPFSNWLARLRSFDTPNFDSMIRRCISTLTSTREGCELLNDLLLPIVISGSCMSLAEYSAFVQAADQSGSHMVSSLLSKMELMKALIPNAEGKPLCTPQDAYKFKLEQQMFTQNFPGTVISLLQGILSTNLVNHGRMAGVDDSDIVSPNLIHFLIGALATSKERRTEFANMLRNLNERSTRQGCLLVNSLLDPSQTLDLINAALAEKPARIIGFINELSAPFCTLALDAFQCEMAVEKSSTMDFSQNNELATLLLHSIITAANEEDSTCFNVLSGLHLEIRRQLFQVAEARILNSTIDSPESIRALQSNLRVAERTSSSLGAEGDTSVSPIILDKFKAIINNLAAELDNNQADNTIEEEVKTDPVTLEQWISALSCLVIIRKRACGSHKFQPHDNMTLFSLLSTIILFPQLQPLTDTIDFVFDVLVMLVDDFTDEQRSFMAKSDFWRASDARLNFLQGPTGTPTLDTWLGLVLTQPPPPSGSTGSNSTPSSQSTPAAPRTPITQPSSQPSPRPQAPQPSRGQQQPQSHQGSMRGSAAQSGNAPKATLPPVQFPLKYWELIWDQGSTGAANDTAISLGLFGLRKA